MAFYTDASLKAELQQQGFRLTPQRETILRVFQTIPRGKHLSAEELHTLLQSQGERISLATVYRTVKLMARMGILRELELAEGHKHYEINHPCPQHHHHLVCVHCHKTIEFTNDLILQICRKQATGAGYEMLHCQLTIHAICPAALQQGWPSVLPSDWECPIARGVGDESNDESNTGFIQVFEGDQFCLEPEDSDESPEMIE